MSSYAPQPGVHVGRPPCLNCGANWHLHREQPRRYCSATQSRWNELRHCSRLAGHGGQRHRFGRHWREEPVRPCPEPYRPPTLEVAQAALEQAEASGDQARIFTARGEVQRLGGRP